MTQLPPSSLHSDSAAPSRERMIAADEHDAFCSPAGFRITLREREVIECLCADMTVKLIACHLHLSEFTVQDHIKNIKRKLDVHTVNGLVARAIRSGVLPPFI